MKKVIIILIILLASSLGGVRNAKAVPPPSEDDLIVEFEQMPLFTPTSTNMFPGESVTRWVRVTNNTNKVQNVAIETINESDPDNLASNINVEIKEGAITQWNGTLEGLFNEGELLLSSLAKHGGNTEYTFIITLPAQAEDVFQEASVGFDVVVGFREVGEAAQGSEEINETKNSGNNGNENNREVGASGGGGGGGIALPPGLSVLDEAATSTEVTATSAVIRWVTSYRSTSRVVYGSSPNLFRLDGGPNYGYPSGTSEFDTPANINGVTMHQVILSNLTPGTVYYFRAVSHASPDTVTREFGFITQSEEKSSWQEITENQADIKQNSSDESDTVQFKKNSMKEGGEVKSMKQTKETLKKEKNASHPVELAGLESFTFEAKETNEENDVSKGKNNQFGNMLGAMISGNWKSSWPLWVLVIIVVSIIGSWRRKRSKRMNHSVRETFSREKYLN